MQQLEQTLDNLLVKKAPFQLPEGFRQGLVKFLPWLVLLGGGLSLLAAFSIYQALTYVSTLGAYWAPYVGANTMFAAASPLLWISLVIVVVEAVLMFAAYPGLDARKKQGWNILFWVSLTNAVIAVVNLVTGDVGGFIGTVLGMVVGLYILFQIRPYYTGEKKIAAPATGATMAVPKETPAAGTSAAEKPASKTPEKKA